MRILITGGNGNLARIIMRHLSGIHDIVSPGRSVLDMLDGSAVCAFFDRMEPFDVIIHAAVRGGRRTRPDTSDDFRDNMLMMENLLYAARGRVRILHFDSGALYGRSSSIRMLKEDAHRLPPTDPYGLSKFCIYQRTLHDPRVRHLRIFNIFHGLEEEDRFIRSCVRCARTGEAIEIRGDRLFDFFSEEDFVAVVHHYIQHADTPKVVNLCYTDKHMLSEVAGIIGAPVRIIPTDHQMDYCGDGSLLASMGLDLKGLHHGLESVKKLF